MKRLVVAFAMALPLPASAQVFRAYLASYGNDGNAGCAVSAPCRLLPAALAAVADGGEIWMLDSANFNAGTVNVSKSATILAIPGQRGSIASVAGTPAISIGSNAVKLTLRNVAILNNANNPGGDGVFMPTGGMLTVENSVIAVNATAGTAINATGGTVNVINSIIRGSAFGVAMRGNGSTSIAGSHFIDIGQYGVWGDGSVASTQTAVTVADSSFDHVLIAIYAWTVVATANVKISVTRASITNSSYGVASEVDNAGGVAVATVGNSMLTSIANAAFSQFGSGAVMETQGNNLVRNNGVNSQGSLTVSGSL